MMRSKVTQQAGLSPPAVTIARFNIPYSNGSEIEQAVFIVPAPQNLCVLDTIFTLSFRVLHLRWPNSQNQNYKSLLISFIHIAVEAEAT